MGVRALWSAQILQRIQRGINPLISTDTFQNEFNKVTVHFTLDKNRGKYIYMYIYITCRVIIQIEIMTLHFSLQFQFFFHQINFWIAGPLILRTTTLRLPLWTCALTSLAFILPPGGNADFLLERMPSTKLSTPSNLAINLAKSSLRALNSL